MSSQSQNPKSSQSQAPKKRGRPKKSSQVFNSLNDTKPNDNANSTLRTDLTSSPSALIDPHLYCICQTAQEGNMIGCDGQNCLVEWFHMKCLGITSAPIGDWYCPSCVLEQSQVNPISNTAQNRVNISAIDKSIVSELTSCWLMENIGLGGTLLKETLYLEYHLLKKPK
jgi:hypothetical protein